MKSLREAREHYELVRRTAEAEVRAEVSKRVEGARYEMARTAHALKASGMNVAQLARDYGTTDRGTIYRLLDAYSFAADIIQDEIAEIERIDPRAFITVNRLESGLIELTGTDVPPAFWTFPEGMTKHPTEPWNGTTTLDWTGRGIALKVSGKAELQVEWNKGTALDYVKGEL